MVKKALVFVSDPHQNDGPWKNHEYHKANRFMEGLLAWEYDNTDIVVIGDPNRFFHGDHQGLCKTAKDQDLYDAMKTVVDTADVTDYSVWLSDNCPLVSNPPVFQIKQNGIDYDSNDPEKDKISHDPEKKDDGSENAIFTEHINKMIAKAGLNNVTLFLSGPGSGNIANTLLPNLEDPNHKVTLIASNTGDIDFPNPEDVDKFDIGIVMPQVQANQYEQAYWAEVARLNGEQTPLIWP